MQISANEKTTIIFFIHACMCANECVCWGGGGGSLKRGGVYEHYLF